MGMRRAKSIEDIYSEVGDYDMVMTNDAPLATALNGLYERPRMGPWAITPRQMARQESLRILREPIWSDIRLITTISRKTGLDIRLVHGELENLRRMRRYTSRIEEHIHSSATRRIWDAYLELPTLEKTMTRFDPSVLGGMRVAVVGLETFDDLDKHMLPPPECIHEVEPFTDEEYGIDSIWAMGSDREMASHVIDLIDDETAENTAIVLNTTGPIADAVRSALYRKGIPFRNFMELRDVPFVRNLIQMLELSLHFTSLRVRDVRSLLLSLGCFIPDGMDNVRLTAYPIGEGQELLGMMASIGSYSYEEVAGAFSDRTSSALISVLEEMGMLHEKVDRDGVDMLIYALDSIDHGETVELPEDEKRGVALIDCLNSSYIDRSLVFYMGLDASWTPSIIPAEYLDTEREIELEETRFQILMQQGDQRFYVVHGTGRGPDDVPCVLFERVTGSSLREGQGFEGISIRGCRPMHWLEEGEDGSTPDTTATDELPAPAPLSPSSIKDFLICPKSYQYSRLVMESENEHTLFGSLMHYFAQFCISYPELPEQNGIDIYLEIMMDEYSSLREPFMSELDRTRAKMAMERILTFVREIRCEYEELVEMDEGDIKECSDGTLYIRNPFMRYHGLMRKSPSTEVTLASEDGLFRGRLDFLAGQGIAVDFKTGKMKPMKNAVSAMDLGSVNGKLDIQPLAYLYLMGSAQGPSERRIVFYYPLSTTASDGCDRNTFVYKCMDMDAYVRNGELVRRLKDFKKYESMLDGKEEEFERCLLSTGVIGCRHDWAQDPAVLSGFLEISPRWKKENVVTMLHQVQDIMDGKKRAVNGEFTVLQEEMDRLRSCIASSSSSVQRMMAEGFPPRPADPAYCTGRSIPSCPYADMCIWSERS